MYMRLANFQAKSLRRHIMASEMVCSQKTGLLYSLGMTPWYSAENGIMGATVP